MLTNGLRIHLGVQAVEVVNTEDKCSCNLAVAQVGEVEDGRMGKEVVRTIIRFCPEEDVSLK